MGPAGADGAPGNEGPAGSGGLTGVTTAVTGGLVGGATTGAVTLSLRTDCAAGETLRRTTAGWECSGMVSRTVAIPAFEFRGPGVNLALPANSYAQAATTGNFLTAPLHLPVGATLTEVKCMVASPDLSTAILRVYQGGSAVTCSSLLTASSGGPAVEFAATCSMPILATNYYYLQISNTTSTGLTVEGACSVKYRGD